MAHRIPEEYLKQDSESKYSAWTIGGPVPGCWDVTLTTPPGAVQIATTGTWGGRSIGLTGGDAPNCNHAKLGVSLAPSQPLCLFGDMNQQGALDSTCESS